MIESTYLTLRDHDKSVSQLCIDGDIVVDLDADGNVLGIERLGDTVDFYTLIRVVKALSYPPLSQRGAQNPTPAVDALPLPWGGPSSNMLVRIQYGSIGDPYLEIRSRSMGAVAAWSADEGMDELKGFIGALLGGYQQLEAMLKGGYDAVRQAEGEQR